MACHWRPLSSNVRPHHSWSRLLARISPIAACSARCLQSIPNGERNDDNTFQHAAQPRTPHPRFTAGARAGARIHPAADDGPEHRCDDQLRRRAGQSCSTHHCVGHRRLRGVCRLCTLHRAACRLRTGLAGHGPRTRHRPAHRRRPVRRLRADPDGSRHLPHRWLESVELHGPGDRHGAEFERLRGVVVPRRAVRLGRDSGSAVGLPWWCLRSCSA